MAAQPWKRVKCHWAVKFKTPEETYLRDGSELSKVIFNLFVWELWFQFPHVDFTLFCFGFFDSNFFAFHRMFLLVDSILERLYCFENDKCKASAKETNHKMFTKSLLDSRHNSPWSSSGRISFDVNIVNLSKGLEMCRYVLLFSVLKIIMINYKNIHDAR